MVFATISALTSIYRRLWRKGTMTILERNPLSDHGGKWFAYCRKPAKDEKGRGLP
jgi:hypothetical protein